jgi:hypothetical protein
MMPFNVPEMLLPLTRPSMLPPMTTALVGVRRSTRSSWPK